MLNMFKKRKGQNTAEYAILIALVVGGVIAMQTYAQRTLQGRLRDASVKLQEDTAVLGTTLQYEPYYTNSSTTSTKDAAAIEDVAGFNNNANISKTTHDRSTWNAAGSY